MAAKPRKRKRRVRPRRDPRLDERSWGPIQLALPAGLVPKELAARLPLHVPTGVRLSDALVELVRPFTRYPAVRGELDDLLEWLGLAASVWNATLEPTEDEYVRALQRTVARWSAPDDDPVDTAETWRIVAALAEHKLRDYPSDGRYVAEIRVRELDGEAIIEAKSIFRERR